MRRDGDCKVKALEIEKLLERPVGIFGWGVSGRGVVKLLEKMGVEYVIYDERVGEGFNVEKGRGHGLVVYSPGFKVGHEWLKMAEEAGCECIGELDFGFLFWKGEVIGVTGTKGKSTTSTLLARGLEAVGERVILCGNIGRSVAGGIAEVGEGEGMVAVCEVSSAQGEGLKYLKLDGLLWTNFSEDHLDYHGNMEGYFKAKWGLIGRVKEGGVVVVGEQVGRGCREVGLRVPEGMEEVFYTEEAIGEVRGELRGGRAWGKGYWENYYLVKRYWERRGLDIGILRKVGLEFEGLKYRMEFVGEVGGKRYWNDSKATNLASVRMALEGFGEKGVLWIGGGRNKGMDIGEFGRGIAAWVREGFLIGEVGEEVLRVLRGMGVRAGYYETLESALKAVRGVEGEWDVVFSPGFTSLDQYKNAEERGESFEKMVLGLK